MPESSVNQAATQLCLTGLFELCPLEAFNLYTEYKRGFPRLRATGWLPCEIIIFSDVSWNLNSLQKVLVKTVEHAESMYYSRHIMDAMEPHHIQQLPFPKLDSLLLGLLRRLSETQDPMARIAVEQLVDGTNINHSWVESHLNDAEADSRSLLQTLVATKPSRIDDFSENQITCFIADEEEAAQIQHIPGLS